MFSAPSYFNCGILFAKGTIDLLVHISWFLKSINGFTLMLISSKCRKVQPRNASEIYSLTFLAALVICHAYLLFSGFICWSQLSWLGLICGSILVIIVDKLDYGFKKSAELVILLYTSLQQCELIFSFRYCHMSMGLCTAFWLFQLSAEKLVQWSVMLSVYSHVMG